MLNFLIKEIVVNPKNGQSSVKLLNFLSKGSNIRFGFFDFMLKVVNCDFFLSFGKPIEDFLQVNQRFRVL